jgi:hypothetical protein
MASTKPITISTTGGDDAGQRLNHLTDRIEGTVHKMPRLASYHFDATAIGVAESSKNSRVTLLTVVTREGKSFQFALSRAVAVAAVMKISGIGHAEHHETSHHE